MKPLSAAVVAGASGCSLAGIIVAGTCWSDGLSTGQRVMTDLAMPIGLAWLAVFSAAVLQWLRGHRLAAGGLMATFLTIGVLFSPIVADVAYRSIETPPLELSPLAAEAPHYTAVIVLGGGASRNIQGQAELNQAGERLALAAKLWHAGKVDAIVCTGTAKPRQVAAASAESMEFEPDDPAEIGREILMALGVPNDHIFRSPGQNTAAEMQHLVKFLAHPPAGFPASDRLGVITSAYHLPRAVRLSQAVGLQLVPLPAGTRGTAKNQRGMGIIVPTAAAGDALATAAKELLARMVGR